MKLCVGFILQSRKANVTAGDVENEMVSTKHELLRVREMLELAEKVFHLTDVPDMTAKEKLLSLPVPFQDSSRLLISFTN